MVTMVWVLTVATYAVILSVTDFAYIPQFAECAILTGFPFAYLIRLFMLVMSTVLIIAINIYLYYKILETKRKYKENLQLHGRDSRNTSKLDALRKRLREHIKPTVSILLLSGIDRLINVATVFMYPLARSILGNNSIARLYLLSFWCYPLNGYS